MISLYTDGRIKKENKKKRRTIRKRKRRTIRKKRKKKKKILEMKKKKKKQKLEAMKGELVGANLIRLSCGKRCKKRTFLTFLPLMSKIVIPRFFCSLFKIAI